MTKEEALNYITKRGEKTLIEHLGVKFINYENETLTATMPVDDATRQVHGFLNGGATLAMAECMAGSLSVLSVPDEKVEYPVGMQVSGNHVSSAMVGDTVIGKATFIHKGKTTHVVNVDVFSQATGKLISTVRVQNFIKKVK